MQALDIRGPLALAAGWLRRNAVALAAANANDPLRLDLPPLLGPGQQAGITASGLHALAALYLVAELEQTGILIVAEALAGVRDAMSYVGIDAARKLDAIARDKTSWERPRREALYARLFGIGGGATRDAGAVNHEFLQTFTALCTALARYDLEDRLAANPGATREAEVRYAASAVLFNLAPRHSGIVALAAQQIHRQVAQAVAALSDRTLLAQFRAQTVWDVVRATLDGAAPDFGRIIRRGESGVHLFDWLTSVMAVVGGASPVVPRLIARGAPVLLDAAQWLEATGLTSIAAPSQNVRRTAGP